MQISHPSTAPDYYSSKNGEFNAGSLRTGNLDTKVLAVGQEGAPNCYRMSIERPGGDSKAEWTTPRHRHNFDQIRFQIEGEWSLTDTIMMRPGMIYYFPESIHYGPQLGKHGSMTLNIQFGGASGNGFIHSRTRARAYHEMIARGAFEKGSYAWTDAAGQRHRMDAYEALWEHVHGSKVHYAPPRYDRVVEINPEAFEWIEDRAMPGVARKLLGVFTENGVRVEFVRVDAGAVVQFDGAAAPELLFIVDGEVSCNGAIHGRHTSFAFEAREPKPALQATKSTVIYKVRLPAFAR